MATKKSTAKTTPAPALKEAPTAIPAKKTTAAVVANRVPSKKMTKSDLIRVMAEKMGVSTKESAAFFDLLATTALEETRTIGEFTIPGIGRLVKAERAARLGRNPQTGDPIKIKAKTTVKFRLAKSAKDAVVPPKS